MSAFGTKRAFLEDITLLANRQRSGEHAIKTA
jgi:hypothetical protein